MLSAWSFYQNVLPNKSVDLNVLASSIIEEGGKHVLHGLGQLKVSVAVYVQEDNLAIDLAKRQIFS